MGPVAEYTGEKVARDVIQEAVNQVVGTSSRKWALVVVALVVGAVVASVVIRRLRRELHGLRRAARGLVAPI